MIYDIQRASFLKRIPAWLLDIILLITLTTGLVAGLSAMLNVDTYSKELSAHYTRYEEKYGIDFAQTEAGFSSMTEEELAAYKAAGEELSKDTEVQKAYEMVVNLTLVTWSLGIFGAHLILEFLIPLAAACQESKDEIYYRCFREYCGRWIMDNKNGSGDGWHP